MTLSLSLSFRILEIQLWLKRQTRPALRANKLVGDMFSTMLTSNQAPASSPSLWSASSFVPSFQTRRGVRRRGGMAVVVRGGAAILSPQCRPGCRRGQWPVRLRAPRPAPAPATTGHCLLLLQRWGQRDTTIVVCTINRSVICIEKWCCCCCWEWERSNWEWPGPGRGWDLVMSGA